MKIIQRLSFGIALGMAALMVAIGVNPTWQNPVTFPQSGWQLAVCLLLFAIAIKP